ncbi:5-formyltetrahydrofolate cyclo-ligase [Ruminococcus sp. OA3]|uniref:5-formyltetrahydrofolate cyclo-ligase n=1 Tax=Ruminococcus sp. OA3 TaxID=2914164 RepID=UPI001F066A3A|nr:5-formyltetrahydrofolate cyclo-ligase [Ruminococcus sp. OA3]MCH1983330.1 5-formyltetrahydrofolate cyclo-ligase [Ruminococcus sp. OA3]
METKQSIRKQVFEYRRQAAPGQLTADSHTICEKILQLPEYQSSGWLYTYMDFNREVHTKELIEAAWAAGKRVAVPKVEGRDMSFYEITSFDQLRPGYFQIPEPEGCRASHAEDAVMIVPGVAFDKMRHRVGYGQGFYDRYLSAHRLHKTVAVAFDFQVMEEVPWEELDVLPQILITQTRIYRQEGFQC